MRQQPSILLLFLLLLLVPFSGSRYLIYVISLVSVLSVAAVGLDILMGYCGQVCFGQAGFVAVGAYATAFLVNQGFSYWMSLPIGGILAALSGLIIGLPALRIRGHYLALATMSFAYIIHLVLIHWEGVTGGPRGLLASRPNWPLSFEDDRYFYFFILIIAIPFFITARNIVKSRYGRTFIAIQKDEIISKSMGINLTRFKTLAFVICSFYGGIAGGLYGPLIGFLDPLSFTILDSAYYIMMIVLGGRGTVFGAVIGAAFFTIVPEILREAKKWQELSFGLIFICFLIFMPDGVMGFLKKVGPFLTEQMRFPRLLSRERRWEAVKLQPSDPSSFSNNPSDESGFLLQMRNISISFGGLQALNRVSFGIRMGEIFSLIGPNGAGKTTTLNIITRLYKPANGSVTFRGQELLKVRADQVIDKRISRTFQNVGLFPGLTALENVMVGLHSFKGAGFLTALLGLRASNEDESRIRAQATEALRLVNLENQAPQMATDLPYGQQKLVGLARALVSRPLLLILDEPASGLSPIEVEKLKGLIQRLRDRQGVTILLVEHDMRVVMEISNRITVLNFGEKIAEGKPEEVRDNPRVVEAYLGEEE